MVDAPPSATLEVLSSHATVVLRTAVTVLSVYTILTWRRAALWTAAPIAQPARNGESLPPK